MAANDPFAQYATPIDQTQPTASADPFAKYATPVAGAVPSEPAAPVSSEAPVPSSDPFAQYATPTSPDNGQPAPEPTQHLYQDSSQPLYKRAWDWLNTPLTESLFGLPEDRPGAGGFERGVEHIASGLTSPLSVALTAATLGTGGFIESAGMSALRESGQFAAEELPQIAKAAKIAQDAFKESKDIEPVIADALRAGGHDMGLLDRARKVFAPLNHDADLANPDVQSSLSKIGLNEAQRTALTEGEMTAAERESIATANGGFSNDELKALSDTGKTVANAEIGFKPIEDAVKEAGVDPDLWKRAQTYLYDNGLNEKDLIGGNMVQRGAYQILRHTVPDLSIAATARAAKTAESVLQAGFTLQQFETAAAMSPRFLDALKEGDTDKAWEYGTEAFAGEALGVLGTSHALHSAGELFKPLIENNKFKPNDEWLAVDRANKEREAQHAEAEQHAINLYTQAKDLLGHAEPRPILGDSKEVKAQKDLELATVLHQIVTGGDADKAAQWHDALAEAAGRTEEPPIVRPNNGPVPNPDVQALAQSYTKSAGIDRAPHEGLASVDPEAAKEVADAYEAMEHNPDDPKVKASYDALIRETKAQWDAAKAAGYKLEPWTGPGQPYASSAEMAEDVRNNKHLFYFQGGEVPENHPLAQVDPETGETYNNIFRAVHDLFGHAKNGYEFGPRGEENAFLSHSKMYSDEAIPALLSETKGQNSWVNFGKHLRDENGNIPVRGEKGFIPPPERPYAEQKAGLLPPEIVNPHLSKEPQVGTPIETPSRAGTQVVHSNDAGEVRVGADGRPVVWLSPEAWAEYNKIAHPGNKISGVSYSPEEAADVAKSLLAENKSAYAQKVLDLFWKAQNLSKQNLLTASKVGAPISVAAEELNHTWQRELSQDGEIRNHLDPKQWTQLSAIIPEAWKKELDADGYPNDPVTRVAETAAQFRSGKATGIVPDTDVVRFLDAYYSEVEAKHGGNVIESARKINDVAAQHVKDIYENRRAGQTATEGGVADRQADNGQLPRVETGRETGTPEVDSGEPQTGLEAKEPDEFNKLAKLRLRVGMGDPGSAGLVTGDNDVFVGRDHAALIREAGYKATPSTDKVGEAIYEKFFQDGGVRIRNAGGVSHIDFKEPNADTWDRVYRSIESMPEANRYYVDFRPVKGGTGFNISAYDKDNLLFQLKDLENGGQRPAAPGSVSYFRNGLLSREGEYRDKEPRFPGLASRGSVTWDDIKPHLSDDVVKHDTEEKQNALTAAFNALPDREDYQAAIRAGRAGQLWYERSSRAFDALMDSGADFLKPKDKTKFLNFVAALSPVQPVRSNLLMALNLWSKWDKAGRPTDVEWKNGVPNKNASLYRILKGRGQTQGVDLPARMNNAIRALQGEPLSGPKVSAFTTNLGTDANRVTNDTWMAVFGDQDPNRINKPAIYDAMSAKVREAAKAEGIAPRQAQAAVWSFIKSLAELSGWGNDRWIPPQEIIKQGLLTPELVGMHSADFADMLQNDPEIREAIRKIGGDLNALDTKLKSYVPGKPASGEAAEANPQLLSAAGRLEAARSNSRIASHLARKQEPGLFDTDFRPNNGMFSREERENLAPTWYLKSNQLIDSRMQGPMPADTVLKMLENNGVKPDELKYTGLQDFLKDKGKEPVRPDELRQYLAANNLQVHEILKGAAPELKIVPSTDYPGEFNVVDVSGRVRYSGSTEQNARDYIAEEAELGNTAARGGTKFTTYTLPGGENYRELLLQLPSEKTGLGLVRPGETLVDALDRRRAESPTFRTSHWDEPNVVGHVRFNDRTGPNGEKLLHLEELQSDWHQKGRTQGYGKAIVEPNTGQFADSRPWRVGNTLFASKQNAEVFAQEQSGRTVPDAPFKKTWPELLLKRMVRYASEHGYDGISWTPGEEQAARYDLSKVADELRFDPLDNELLVYQNGRPTQSITATENTLADYVGKDAAKNLLESKQNDNGQHVIKGDALRVGGQGMKGFYDKIVPEAANKLGKQFGAKVGETKIDVGKPGESKQLTIEDELDRIKNDPRYTKMPLYAEFDNDGRMTLSGDPEVLRRPVLIADKDGSVYTDRFAPKKGTVPYFPITDSMRESVLKQGQPLFARSPDNGQLDEQIRSNVFKNQPKEYQDLVLESLRRVASGELSDREQAAAKFLRDEQDKNFEIGSSNDLLHHYIEDYMTRVYKDTNPLGKVITSEAKGGRFATNVSMAKQRVYDSNLTALLKSPKQMLLDPVDITAKGRAMLIKAAANRQLIDTLMDKFIRASDGRPAAVFSGSGQVVSGQNGEDPRIFIDQNRVRKINIDPKVVDQLSKSGDLQRYLADGTIKDITPYVRPNNIGAAIEKLEEQAQRKNAQYDEVGNNKLRTDLMFLKSMQANGDFSGLKAFNDAQEKQYAWDPQDYISLANGAMKGWNFITNSPDGTPIYVRSDIRVHPEFAEYLQNRLGLAPSDIAKHPIGKALLGAGTKLKQTLLSLSPFHMVQEALRGIMVGVNPFHITGPDILTGEKVDPSDPNSPTIIRKAVEHGFTTGTDYSALQAHSEGLASGGGGLLSKIPGVGRVLSNSLDWYQNFLFKRYIPALKARSVELMFHEYQRLHPEWSVDRVAKAAALHANDTFGGINWQAMGRSATTQDWGRLMLLAPDWLEAEMRSGARLFNKDDGGLGRAQVAKMALGLWGIARVLNLVTTGNAHYEAPFGLAVKNKEGKETVFSIRTLPTDLLSAAADPVRFITGRLSPTFRAGEELAFGRDQFGRKLQPSDLWADVFRNMAPIPLQSLGQAVSDTGPQIGNIGQGWKSIGGTAQTYQTPAGKMAADLASSHSEDGPVDPSQMARHHRVIQLEDKVRAGELSWPDLYKLTYQTDQLKESELKKIQENVKATHDMSPDMASLYTRASRLPAKEYLDLLDVTNPAERAALVPLTIKVQKRYLTKAKKEETPEERAKDPVFQRFLRMIPGSTQDFQPQPQSSVVPPIPAPIQKEVAYLYTATHPETGHRVGSNDGQTWYDHQTGVPVNG